MKQVLILCLIFLSTLGIAPLSQQDNPPCKCCGDEYRQFDFWIGDWMVFDTTGKLVGNNQIVLLEDHCVLQENWKSGDSKYSGTSYNYYDNTDETWNQLWLDNQGGILKLKKESTSHNISKVAIYNTTTRRAELLY